MSPGKAIVTIRGVDTDVVLKALSPEAGRGVPRSRVELSKHEDSIVISLETEDVAALRAALNSYLRWTDVAVNITKGVGK